MHPTYKPFQMVFRPDGLVSHLVFKEDDPIWSTNFKRAIAAMLQFQMKKSGAFVVNEVKEKNESFPPKLDSSNSIHRISNHFDVFLLDGNSWQLYDRIFRLQ